jgi:hypothetical protein
MAQREQGGFTEQAFTRLPERYAVAIRFWEPRRLSYNLALAAFFLAWVVGTWPHFRKAMALSDALQLAVLALLANLCYSTAYIAEPLVQLLRPGTGALRLRSALWIFGTVLAVLFENYWIADEIYPFVR